MVKFVSMQCNMFYDVLDYEANELAIKKALGQYYSDGIMANIDVPVSVPREIPRLICHSKNGHSQVIVSGNCMQLAVGFDDNFSDDADKCYDYLAERANVIRKCLKDLKVDISFIGIVAQAKEEFGSEPEKELMKKFFSLKTSKPVFDVLGKVTFVESDTYYINITLSNMRDGLSSKNIGITLDINDRYRLNYRGEETPFSMDNALEAIISKHKVFFADKAEKLLREGIYDDA